MRPIVIAFALALAACGSTTAPPPPQAAQPAAQPATPGGLYDRELDKAKAVEGQVLEQKKDLDKAIDEQGD
jgi:hypothetical protein